jgi:uroporphyrinogen decarboxylase
MAALELREPDQVPILEWVIHPRVIQQLCPQAKDRADFDETMELDATCCWPQYNRISEYEDGTYFDEWRVLFKSGPEVEDHPMKGPIQTQEDLNNYVPPDPDAPHRLGKLPELVARFKKKKAIIFFHRIGFILSSHLNGLENLLMNLLAAPEFAHQLLDKVLETNMRIARRAIRTGADIIVLGDDYAGNTAPLVSPAVFAEFMLPRLTKMVNLVHEEGAKVIEHSDGHVWPLLDMIVGAGVDAINPIEPAAGMDIGEVKQKYGHRVCLIGNIDCSHLLSEGSVEEVEAAVKECIRKASPGGGHIISSSNSVLSSVKPENYLALIQAAKRYGKYPICANG